MRFRPCIDIHNGKVKQIVGGSLKDEGNQVSTNFTSELDAAWYARMKLKGIDGDPHKRWSMWFNSKQREEPYQVLTSF